MKNLITVLLEYSRLRSSPGTEETVSLQDVMVQVKDDLELSIRERNATVKVGPLPILRENRLELKQLLQNLVEVSATDDNGSWTISVQANGIRIAPEYQGRIFQVFQRLHGKDQFPGTGIGLALRKMIVERLGGRI